MIFFVRVFPIWLFAFEFVKYIFMLGKIFIVMWVKSLAFSSVIFSSSVLLRKTFHIQRR